MRLAIKFHLPTDVFELLAIVNDGRLLASMQASRLAVSEERADKLKLEVVRLFRTNKERVRERESCATTGSLRPRFAVVERITTRPVPSVSKRPYCAVP